MKTRKCFSEKTLSLLFALALSIVMMCAFAVNTQAAATKIKPGTTADKAVAVKVNNTYTVYWNANKSGEKFLKFTAPSTATYRFDFSNLCKYGYASGNRNSGILGSVGVYLKKKGSANMELLEVTTNGGKDDFLSLESLYWYNLFDAKNPVTSGGYLPSRYAKVKLNKGDTLIFRNYFCGNPYSYTLKVGYAASIKLSATSATLKVGASKTLKATVVGSSKTVKWTTSNSKVATVSASGKITAKKKGTCTITATANGVRATCKITVK